MDVYLRHTQRAGVIAFHVSNCYLELAPVVEKIARAKGLHAALVDDNPTNSHLDATDWVLASRDPLALIRKPIRGAASSPVSIAGLKPWTDEFNNLFGVLK